MPRIYPLYSTVCHLKICYQRSRPSLSCHNSAFAANMFPHSSVGQLFSHIAWLNNKPLHCKLCRVEWSRKQSSAAVSWADQNECEWLSYLHIRGRVITLYLSQLQHVLVSTSSWQHQFQGSSHYESLHAISPECEFLLWTEITLQKNMMTENATSQVSLCSDT